MSTDFSILDRLLETIESRRGADPSQSYVASLCAAGRPAIARKVGEEALETALAAVGEDKAALASESADLLFHLLVLWAEAGIDPAAVMAELARREGRSGLEEKRGRG